MIFALSEKDLARTARFAGITLLMGGPKVETTNDILKMDYDSIQAGGAGVSIGRNVFQHQNPTSMVKAFSAIVHFGATVEDALKILGGVE